MKGTKVDIAICPNCRCGIYSVATHDFHYCPCGSLFIDGGFDYMRVGGAGFLGRVRYIALNVPQSKAELLKDYNESYRGIDSTRKYGTLSWDEIRELYNAQLKKDIRMVAPKSTGTAKRTRSKTRKD